jgi:hypothetical protein
VGWIQGGLARSVHTAQREEVVTTSRTRPPLLPEHWTPDEALAVFELLDQLRDHLYALYGHEIQRAFRACDVRQRSSVASSS